MAEAEPVIRAALPDANVPTSIRRTGVPVRHGSAATWADPRRVARAHWLAEHAEGVACVIGDPGRSPATSRDSRVRWLTPELAKGLEFDLVVLVDPDAFGDGHRGSRRPLRRDDPRDAAARHPHVRSCAGLRTRSWVTSSVLSA